MKEKRLCTYSDRVLIHVSLSCFSLQQKKCCSNFYHIRHIQLIETYIYSEVKLFVHSGIIRTALPNMDREARQEYNVVIQAKDMGGHMGGLSGTTEVKITLTDVNDNPPKFPLSECKHQRDFCVFLSPETSAENGLPSFP